MIDFPVWLEYLFFSGFCLILILMMIGVILLLYRAWLNLFD